MLRCRKLDPRRNALRSEMPDPTAEIDQLAHAIRERRAILFVGAGVSMSVGLPSWDRLIVHMKEQLNLDADELTNWQGSYQTLAEYYQLKMGSLGPLRSWMDRHWIVSREEVEQSELHRLIVEARFPDHLHDELRSESGGCL